MTCPDTKPDVFTGKRPLKPVVFSVLTLISGIVIGAGLTLLFKKPTPKIPPGPEFMSSRMLERIIYELQLPPEQAEQLKPIIRKHMTALDQIRGSVRVKVSEEIKQMNEEILSVLQPPQKQMWEERMQRLQDHFTNMRQRRGPGGERREGPRPEFGPDQPDRRRRYPDRRPPEPQISPENDSLGEPPLQGPNPENAEPL